MCVCDSWRKAKQKKKTIYNSRTEIDVVWHWRLVGSNCIASSSRLEEIGTSSMGFLETTTARAMSSYLANYLEAERLSEAACVGDIEAVKVLLEVSRVRVVIRELRVFHTH